MKTATKKGLSIEYQSTLRYTSRIDMKHQTCVCLQGATRNTLEWKRRIVFGTPSEIIPLKAFCSYGLSRK